MDAELISSYLEMFREGKISWRDLLARIQNEVGNEVVGVLTDPLRWERIGFPEVVMGRGKSLAQLKEAVAQLLPRVMVSRLTEEQVERFEDWSLGKLILDEHAGIAYSKEFAEEASGSPRVVILTGGAADFPVARECQICLSACGINTKLFADVGVAGPHRIYPAIDHLQVAKVAVVVAGMEASLATLVASLTSAPVLAVPSSGGGASPFGGIESLIAMVSSCVPGVQVVGIDSGVSAAAAVVRILGLGNVEESEKNQFKGD